MDIVFLTASSYPYFPSYPLINCKNKMNFFQSFILISLAVNYLKSIFKLTLRIVKAKKQYGNTDNQQKCKRTINQHLKKQKIISNGTSFAFHLYVHKKEKEVKNTVRLYYFYLSSFVRLQGQLY